MGKKELFQILTSVAIGFLISGIILIINRSQPKTSITLYPPPTPKPIMVYISGNVQKPDVYALPKGSRLNDLLIMAGGLRDPLSEVEPNLAAILYDGQHVIIKEPNANHEPEIYNEDELTSSNQKININEAPLEDLIALPGIGTTKAEAIIQYRETTGPFEQIKDILNVPGIGDYTFQQIEDLITINQIYK